MIPFNLKKPIIIALIVFPVLIGWIISYYHWVAAIAVLGVIIILYLYWGIFKHWEKGVYWLMAYMPLSGLLGILLYPYLGSGWASLAKDFLFVLPTYLAFFWWYVKKQRQLPSINRSSRFTIFLMFILAGLVLFHCFNPQLVNPMVALIGLKVWLFYIPLYMVGIFLIKSRMQLIRLMQMILILGMIPALYGILQAALIYSGYGDIAYALHGPAAEEATQMFARFEAVGGAGLIRVPSLFTFPMQYSSFLFVLLAVAYSLWIGGDPKGGKGMWYVISLIATIVALSTSGVRAVYAILPAFFILTFLLHGRWKKIWKPAFVLVCLVPLGVGVLLYLVGSTWDNFVNFAAEIMVGYLGTGSEMSLIKQFEYALSLTSLGMGTGMNTGQARYALGSDAESSYVNMTFNAGIESFPGKLIVEIGIPGLILVSVLLGWLLLSSYRRLKQLQEPDLRSFSVCLFSFLAVTVAYLYKGCVLDYDPLNVYFWLFAGIIAKLPEIQGSTNRAR